MEIIMLVLKRCAHAIGVALIHVVLFLAVHGAVSKYAGRELPRVIDDVIEIASEAVTYTAF